MDEFIDRFHVCIQFDELFGGLLWFLKLEAAKWMNEWTNERMNEWMNEWMNKINE